MNEHVLLRAVLAEVIRQLSTEPAELRTVALRGFVATTPDHLVLHYSPYLEDREPYLTFKVGSAEQVSAQGFGDSPFTTPGYATVYVKEGLLTGPLPKGQEVVVIGRLEELGDLVASRIFVLPSRVRKGETLARPTPTLVPGEINSENEPRGR